MIRGCAVTLCRWQGVLSSTSGRLLARPSSSSSSARGTFYSSSSSSLSAAPLNITSGRATRATMATSSAASGGGSSGGDADVRVESDSMGMVRVPADRYYGAQSQRSITNFNIGTEIMPREVRARFTRSLRLASLSKHACKPPPPPTSSSSNAMAISTISRYRAVQEMSTQCSLSCPIYEPRDVSEWAIESSSHPI
jgi:hypothetical protein